MSDNAEITEVEQPGQDDGSNHEINADITQGKEFENNQDDADDDDIANLAADEFIVTQRDDFPKQYSEGLKNEEPAKQMNQIDEHEKITNDSDMAETKGNDNIYEDEFIIQGDDEI